MFGSQRAVMMLVVSMLCSACAGVQPQPGGSSSEVPEVTPTGNEIAFRVIEQVAPLGDHPKEPFFMIATSLAEWETLVTKAPAQALETGRKAFQTGQKLYLLAFAGVRGTSGFMLSIDSIRREGNQFTVVVTETKPAQGTIVEPAMTLPYILVAVPLTELPHGENVVFVFTNPQGTILGQEEVQLP